MKKEKLKFFDFVTNTGKIFEALKYTITFVITLSISLGYHNFKINKWESKFAQHNKQTLFDPDREARTVAKLEPMLNKFKQTFECDWSAVYLYLNGEKYVNGIHKMKFCRYAQSTYVNPFSREVDEELSLMPLRYLYDAKLEMENKGRIVFSTKDSLYPYANHILNEYGINSMVCIPIVGYYYNQTDKLRYIGFLSYEYKKHITFDSLTLTNMAKDMLRIEEILKE